jgi:hypothetical protein
MSAHGARLKWPPALATLPRGTIGCVFDSPESTGPVPALQPWHPGDGLTGAEPVNRLQEARFTDGLWHLVTVRAQARSRRGWAVLLEFYGARGGERWVIYDPHLIREPFGG